jgi:hypothetical protein
MTDPTRMKEDAATSPSTSMTTTASTTSSTPVPACNQDGGVAMAPSWSATLLGGAVTLSKDPVYCAEQATSRGHCEGDVLAYCQFGTKVQVNCTSYGQRCVPALTASCGVIDPNATPYDPTDPCQRLGGRGECADGMHLRYCSAGTVIEVDCATIPGTVCMWGTSGWSCADPRSP